MLVSIGENRGNGNLLGLQPAVSPADYASVGRLYTRLAPLFDQARSAGLLGPQTIVVLPEYLGTWLALIGAPSLTLHAPRLQAAFLSLVLVRLPGVVRAMRNGRASARLQEALFRSAAPVMASAYQALAGCLSKTYGVTLVAGTLVLPDPQIVVGQIQPGTGHLYNAAFVFRPDGSLHPFITCKIAPIDTERGFTAAASVGDLPIYETPAGRLGVIVCADSWYPEPYQRLQKRGATLLAVPSYLSPTGVWERPWSGYNPGPAPVDVDQRDTGQLTEGQAWQRYALATRGPANAFHAGINVFLRGSLWELGSAGQSMGFCGTAAASLPDQCETGLVNVWLE